MQALPPPYLPYIAITHSLALETLTTRYLKILHLGANEKHVAAVIYRTHT